MVEVVSQRGRLLARNTCREPFTHTTVGSLKQTVSIRGAAFETELDLYNVLNLLNSKWGLQRLAVPRLLEHVGQTAGSAETSQSIFRFDPKREKWSTLQEQSAFQIQLAVRYIF